MNLEERRFIVLDVNRAAVGPEVIEEGRGFRKVAQALVDAFGAWLVGTQGSRLGLFALGDRETPGCGGPAVNGFLGLCNRGCGVVSAATREAQMYLLTGNAD